MKEILWGIAGVAVGFALLYLRFRADYRLDRLNVSPRVKIQTLFGRYEENDEYRK